jgi:hypothetical protein
VEEERRRLGDGDRTGLAAAYSGPDGGGAGEGSVTPGPGMGWGYPSPLLEHPTVCSAAQRGVGSGPRDRGVTTGFSKGKGFADDPFNVASLFLDFLFIFNYLYDLKVYYIFCYDFLLIKI